MVWERGSVGGGMGEGVCRWVTAASLSTSSLQMRDDTLNSFCQAWEFRGKEKWDAWFYGKKHRGGSIRASLGPKAMY